MRLGVQNKIIGCRVGQINLANMQIKDDEIQEIIQKIKQVNPDITTIDLDENLLTDKGASILAEFLPDFAKLSVLSLQFNDIGREGALDVYGLKKEFAALQILFHGNNICDVDEMNEIKESALRRGGVTP